MNIIDLKQGDKVNVTVTKQGNSETYGCICGGLKLSADGLIFKTRATDGKRTFFLSAKVSEAQTSEITDPVDGEVWSTLV
jgi:hypothetical protein